MRLPNRFRASKAAAWLRRLLLRRYDVIRVHRVIPEPDLTPEQAAILRNWLIGEAEPQASFGVKHKEIDDQQLRRVLWLRHQANYEWVKDHHDY